MKKESLIVWGIAAIVLLFVVFGIYKMSGVNPSELVMTEPVSTGDHGRGNPSAKAVLVEYGDYQCPACYQYEPLIQKLLVDEKDKVYVVFRNFPLPQHQYALPSAYAAEAAGLQGKFWEMHDIIYERQNEWSPSPNGADFFIQYAKDLKLDMNQFQKDIASAEIKDRVSREANSARSMGVSSTPTFFLNGKSITVKSYEQLRQLIESANVGS